MMMLPLKAMIAFCILTTADACMTKQEPKPKTVTTAPGPTTKSPIIKVQECTNNDTYYNKCLHEGKCRVDVNTIDNSRLSYCRCTKKYVGSYCQKYRILSLSQGSLVAAVIVSGVLAIIVIAVLLYVWRIRKHHQESKTLDRPKRRETTPSQFSQYSSSNAQNGGREQVELLQLHSTTGIPNHDNI